MLFVALNVIGCTISEQLDSVKTSEIDSNTQIKQQELENIRQENNNLTALQIAQIQATTVANQAIITATVVAYTSELNKEVALNTNETLVLIEREKHESNVDYIFWIFLTIVISVSIYSFLSSRKKTYIVLPNTTQYKQLSDSNIVDTDYKIVRH